MPVIEVAELRRTYHAKTGIRRRSSREVEAVRGISFEVERGELFGLLGPNGAGKTTTIKMLITLLLPGLLLARVDGKSPVEYLTTESQRDTVRRVARALLTKPTDRLMTVRAAWGEEIGA